MAATRACLWGHPGALVRTLWWLKRRPDYKLPKWSNTHEAIAGFTAEMEALGGEKHCGSAGDQKAGAYRPIRMFCLAKAGK